MARRLAAIMFTDIADYGVSAWADEGGASQLVRDLEELARPMLRERHGHRVRVIGDDRLIEFSDAIDAVEGGVDLQRSVHERNRSGEATALRVRVGIHLGDAERRGIGVQGDAVDIVSRIGPLADPGGICLTEPVYVQVRNRVPYQLRRLGPRDLKGRREPIAVYHVALPWSGEEAASDAAIPTSAPGGSTPVPSGRPTGDPGSPVPGRE